VILVGEIRDRETARMAMQAATTGHLVLTTIHARDTVGTIFRLLDLGVEPFLISNALTMCISQRLVRVLCPNCKRPFKPDARMIREMHMEGRAIDVLYDAVGCKRCMNAGYRGRMALFETLSFNAQLRDVILEAHDCRDSQGRRRMDVRDPVRMRVPPGGGWQDHLRGGEPRLQHGLSSRQATRPDHPRPPLPTADSGKVWVAWPPRP